MLLYLAITKKYNITHPLEMLHSAITKSTTTTPITQTLPKVQHNPPPKYVAFGYYQKCNNNNRPINSNITEKV